MRSFGGLFLAYLAISQVINEIHIQIKKKKCLRFVCILVPLAAASEYLMPFIICPRESMSTSYINVSNINFGHIVYGEKENLYMPRKPDNKTKRYVMRS